MSGEQCQLRCDVLTVYVRVNWVLPLEIPVASWKSINLLCIINVCMNICVKM